MKKNKNIQVPQSRNGCFSANQLPALLDFAEAYSKDREPGYLKDFEDKPVQIIASVSLTNGRTNHGFLSRFGTNQYLLGGMILSEKDCAFVKIDPVSVSLCLKDIRYQNRSLHEVAIYRDDKGILRGGVNNSGLTLTEYRQKLEQDIQLESQRQSAMQELLIAGL